MKSAYLYIRVSTDEQKRKGYSLPEQEDRLIKYCEFNNIHIEGIYREDFSAKNFNRPEWYIAPKQPEADLIQQLAKNSFAIEEIRRMVNAKGLKCSRSNFWRQIRNPAYCGIITVQLRDNEEQQSIKGVHEPIISEALFSDVQNVIKTKRKIKGKTDELKAFFTLRGYLICPACNRKLTGCFCKGYSKKYPYYNCNGKCGIRFRAELINDLYEKLIESLILFPGANELFKRILDDVNTATQRAQYLQEKKILLEQIEEQEKTISKARKLYLSEKFEFDDFSEALSFLGQL